MSTHSTPDPTDCIAQGAGDWVSVRGDKDDHPRYPIELHVYEKDGGNYVWIRIPLDGAQRIADALLDKISKLRDDYEA